MKWLLLSDLEQREVLETVAGRSGRSEVILEKDLWVVWVLARTFECSTPDLPLAFKGGTSLAKAYRAIERFSEDLDLTLGLLGGEGRTLEALAALSRAGRDRAVARLKQDAQAQVLEAILPHLKQAALALDPRLSVEVEGQEADLKLALHYPSALPGGSPYIRRRVLLEFGGKNAITPRQPVVIRSYLAEDPQLEAALDWPEAAIEVLDARRTFWEKLTALHVACHQPEKLHRLNYFSRHLLDLHTLMQGTIGPAALESIEIRDDVIATKALLFRETGVDYQDCRTGRATLVPQGEVRRILEADYRQMVESGMYGPQTVPFAAVLETLERLEKQVNGEAFRPH